MTAQEFFKNDRFATNASVELIEIKEGYSKARLVITAEHLNAGGRTQGGAIFTLADLALAAAANSHGTLAFSLSSNITFLRSSGPGDVLYAEARERYIGRTTGYYQIDVRGMRASEALDATQEFIDDAIMLGFSEVRILHGKGTGALKEEIRKYLRTVDLVASAKDEHEESGGAGITVVRLEL